MKSVSLRACVCLSVAFVLSAADAIAQPGSEAGPLSVPAHKRRYQAEVIEPEQMPPVDDPNADKRIHFDNPVEPPTDSDSDTPAHAAEAKAPTTTDAEATALLNLKDAELTALIKGISKLTGRNFILDNSLKGKKVSVHLATPVTTEEALKIFDTLLLQNGFTTVPMGGSTYKVIPAKDARQTTIPLETSGSRSATDALVTQLIRLRYVSAPDMQQIVQPLISKDGMVTAFTGTNALIIIDSGANISRIRKIINEVDVPAVDQDITIIRIQHASAKDVAETVKEILTGGDDNSSSGQAAVNPMFPFGVPNMRPGVPAVPGQPLRRTMGGTVERRVLPLKLIPDERTNSIIVVADEETTNKVKALAEQLDSKLDLSGGGFYVHRLQHADAEEVANLLSQLITGEGGSVSGSRSSGSGRSSSSSNSPFGSGFGSGFGNSSSSRFGSSSRGSMSRNSSSLSQIQPASAEAFGGTSQRRTGTGFNSPFGGGFSSGGEGRGRVQFEGEISIAADPSTNSLVINASRADYQRVKDVIEQLDIKRRQVLVEATVLEVALDGREAAGVELQGTVVGDDYGVIGKTDYGNLANLLTNPAALSDLTIAAASTGTITLPGGIVLPTQAVLVQAVSRHSNVNVLSSPTVLATDNEEAKIVIGENVPFVTGTGTDSSNLRNTFNQVTREDVGIKLFITPQISAGDFVLLKTFVEISSIKEGTESAENGPTTTLRTTETMVEVKSGQMVVTGGLIQDQQGGGRSGVPFLQDIPVLGILFRRDTSRSLKTNLLIFITPKIIKDQFDAREETKSRMNNLREKFKSGGVEDLRDEVFENPAVDKVIDLTPPGNEQPGTILPSEALSGEQKAALDRTRRRLGILAPSAAGGNPGSATDSNAPDDRGDVAGDAPASGNEDDVIELTVTPKLPPAHK